MSLTFKIISLLLMSVVSSLFQGSNYSSLYIWAVALTFQQLGSVNSETAAVYEVQ
jgi:hypothetical protein